MKNSPPSKLDQICESYDVVIVGGGIVGAGLFRDLALHDVKTLLVDKKDFGSQTSQSSSKMLHGGIRYLENFDFKLVWEALHEKNLWLKLAPHLCYEEAFYLPIYKNSLRPLWMLKIGLFLYDFLSSFENSGHDLIDKSSVIKKIPGIKENGLRGAGIYYDAVMDDVKLTLEVIYDGLVEDHADALNYVELQKTKETRNYHLLDLKDSLTGETRQIKANYVIFAAGPFTDQLLTKLKAFPWKNQLLPSKGSHLWIKKESLPITHPMLLTPSDGRVIFVIPQKNKVLVGTTEVEANEDFFDISPSQNEIDYLLKNLGEYFPEKKLTASDIISSFAGIRPLVCEDTSSNRGKTAREHKIYQTSSKTFVILGGKYTTFRVMGQDISENICHKLEKSYSRSYTKRKLRVHSRQLPFVKNQFKSEDLHYILEHEYPRTIQDVLKRRLDFPNGNLNSIPENIFSIFEKNKEILHKHLVLTEEEKDILESIRDT